MSVAPKNHLDYLTQIVAKFFIILRYSSILLQSSTMPHYVSSDDKSPPDGEDEILPDAPPTGVDMTTAEESEEARPTQRSVKLEDMFNGDDGDDDEFPDSSPGDTKMESSPPPVAQAQ